MRGQRRFDRRNGAEIGRRCPQFRFGRRDFIRHDDRRSKIIGTRCGIDLRFELGPNELDYLLKVLGGLFVAVSVAPDRLLLLGVTVLTSANRETLRETGITDDVSQQVVRLAKIGAECGIGGVVASAREIGALRKAIDRNVKLVIPGIRPSGSEEHDQKRTMTPAQAVAAGADYLVVGRPVISAPDPMIAAKQILEGTESAL